MSIIYLIMLCGLAVLIFAAMLEAVLSVSKKPVWQLQRLSAFGAPQALHGQALSTAMATVNAGPAPPEPGARLPGSCIAPEPMPQPAAAGTSPARYSPVDVAVKAERPAEDIAQA